MDKLMTTCPRCSGTDFDRGQINSAGDIYYKSDLQRNPFIASNSFTVLCMGCGYTETYINQSYRDKIIALRSKIEAKKS